MTNLRYLRHFVLAGAALCSAHVALAQSTGLGAKLDEAEKKLDADVKACRPIDVKDYQGLSDEAYRNQKRALAAAADGVPIDAEQIKADSKRASDLFARATAAAAKPCPPPQQKPPQGGQPEKKVESPQTLIVPGGGVSKPKTDFEQFEDEADDAMDDLEKAMAKCDLDAIKQLIPKLEQMAKHAHEIEQAARAAGKFSIVNYIAAGELEDDLDEAIYYAKNFKCSARKPEQPHAEPPKGNAPERPSTAPQGTEKKPGDANKSGSPRHSRLEGLFPNAPSQPKSIEPLGTEGGPNGPQFPQRPETQLKPAAPVVTNAVRLNPQQQRLLDRTNAIRVFFGVKPLRWNDGLATGALEQAKHIAAIKQLQHASKVGRGDVRENLLRIRAGSSPDDMIEVWGAEIGDLIPGVSLFPNSAIDGFWDHVAHLTQIIWPTTTDMGCAWVESDGWIYLVCRYSPGGNKDGKPVGLMSAANDLGAYKRRDVYCSKQQQIDDLFVLQQELINTDESTLVGHLYGDAIRAEIEHVKQAKPEPCARSAATDTASIDLPPDVAPPAAHDRVPQARTADSTKSSGGLSASSAAGGGANDYKVAPFEPPTLHERIEHAEQALNDKIQKCQPINVAEYDSLEQEAFTAWVKWLSAVKVARAAGAPLDQGRMDEAAKAQRDRQKAYDLYQRARNVQQSKCSKGTPLSVAANTPLASSSTTTPKLDGPLIFAMGTHNAQTVNPKNLEYGLDAVNSWNSMEHGLQHCDFAQVDAALGKLNQYYQAAQQQSAAERSTDPVLAQIYADMARQISKRITEGESGMNNCHRPERG